MMVVGKMINIMEEVHFTIKEGKFMKEVLKLVHMTDMEKVIMLLQNFLTQHSIIEILQE